MESYQKVLKAVTTETYYDLNQKIQMEIHATHKIYT